MRSQSVDITNFENKLSDFQTKFNKNVDLAHRQYEDAIAAIDKSSGSGECKKEPYEFWQ